MKFKNMVRQEISLTLESIYKGWEGAPTKSQEAMVPPRMPVTLEAV